MTRLLVSASEEPALHCGLNRMNWFRFITLVLSDTALLDHFKRGELHCFPQRYNNSQMGNAYEDEIIVVSLL